MDVLQKQYQQELVYQEIKSNKYTLKGFLLFFLALAFIWILTITGFFVVDKTLLTSAFVATAVLFFPLLFFYFKQDLSKPWLKYYFLSLICVVSGVIISFLSYHAVLLYVIPLLFAIQYRRRSTIWFAYGVNTVSMLISSLVSFYYGLCDLNLLLESRYTRSWYLSTITDTALNIPFNENPVFIIIVFEVFPRSIILLVFSIMMQYTVVNSNEDALRIAQLTYMKETDIRTKVFNKNKYEKMITDYYPQIAQVAVIFWDLNNLKQINDKYGHATGDQAIEKLASTLYHHSSDKLRVYRFGGDEFLVIIDNPKANEAENFIKAAKKELQVAEMDETLKISSAVGFSYGTGEAILEVVKEADANMYEDKRLCKEGRA